jgi:hypothetical protein
MMLGGVRIVSGLIIEMVHSCDNPAPFKKGQGAIDGIEGNRGHPRLDSLIYVFRRGMVFCNCQFTKYLKALVSELDTQPPADLLSGLKFFLFGAILHEVLGNAMNS